METGAAGYVPGSVSPIAAMALAVFRQVRQALVNLNPAEVRAQADRPVRLGLVAASREALGSMETFFAPHHLSPERRAEAVHILIRGGGPSCDVQIYESSLLRPAKAFSFDPEAPEDCVRRIVRKREDLMLPLARRLDPFRKEVAHHVIRACRQRKRVILPGDRFARRSPQHCVAAVVRRRIWVGRRVSHHESDPHGIPLGRGQRPRGGISRAKVRDCFNRHGRVRMASLSARTGRKSTLRRRPDSKAAIAWAGTFVAGLSLEAALSLGLRFHPHRAPDCLRRCLRKRQTDRRHAARRLDAPAQGGLAAPYTNYGDHRRFRLCRPGRPGFHPRSEEEIAAILVRASSEGVPVTIMGALTGLAGGAVPKSGWAISMAQFRKLDVNPGRARVGTGVLLRDVQAAATASGQFYAPDPTESTSSIGGNIGANASGSRSFRYGATRNMCRR